MILANLAVAGTHRYRETTAGAVIDYSLDCDSSGVSPMTESHKGPETQTTTTDNHGETLSWRIQTPAGEVRAIRRGTTILLEGNRRGEAIPTTVTIDESAWRQQLMCGLESFLQSNQESTVFWKLRPDSLKPLRMKATRLGPVELDLDGRRIPATLVEVRLTGLFSAAWSSRFWYRQSDGLFLRYEGANGLPGTPVTTVVLIE